MNENQDEALRNKVEYATEFDTLCRTCLSKNCVMFNLNAVDVDKNKKFSEMLYECASIQVSENDRLPKIICEVCVCKINAWYEFKANCLKVQETILNQLEQIEKVVNFNLETVKSEDSNNSESDPNNSSGKLDCDDRDGRDDSRDSSRSNLVEQEKTQEKSDNSLSETKWCMKVKGAYRCTICGKEKVKRNLLEQHVAFTHPNLFSSKHFTKHNDPVENNQFFKQEQVDQNNTGLFSIVNESVIEKKIKSMKREEVNSDENSLKVYETNESFKNRRTISEKIEKLSRGYRCTVCNKTYVSLTNMLYHVSFHFGIKHFKCPKCDVRFVTASGANRHVRTVHCSTDPKNKIRIRTMYPCQFCGKVFPVLRMFKKHLRVDHKQDVHHCYASITSIKNALTDDNDSSEEQVTEIRSGKKYKCDLCKMSFHAKQKLMGHRRIHGEKSGYHCKFCMVTCPTPQELDDHIAEAHSDAKVYSCHLCGKEFYVPEYLQKHIKNHTAKPRHLCTFCGKAFSCSSNLTQHIRTHTGERPYVCKICNASFNQHASLRFHSAVHNDERKFVCDICGSNWKRKSELTQHMNKHSESPKFKCDFCEKGFYVRKQLRAHIKIHTGERPYTCKYCEKSFRRSTHLKVHERSHTGERPYVCSVCNRGFIQNHCLVTHMNTHHKDAS